MIGAPNIQPIDGDEFRVDVGTADTWKTASAHKTLPDALEAYDLYVSQLSDTCSGYRRLRIVRNGVHVMLRWDAGRP